MDTPIWKMGGVCCKPRSQPEGDSFQCPLKAYNVLWPPKRAGEKAMRHAHAVFVYGTLRKGGLYNRYLANSTFLGMATATGTLLDLGRFPAAYFSGERTIKGEVYRVTSSVLDALDGLEGFDPKHTELSFYVRRKIKVRLVENGDLNDVWAYEFRAESPRAPVIENGDWVEYLKANGRRR